MFAVYTPSVERAILALIVQVVLLGLLAFAITAYSRRRHPPKHVLIALAVGAVLGWLGGLAYQIAQLAWSLPAAEVWRQFTDWVLIAYIELYWGTISTFFGMLASWLSLEMAGPRGRTTRPPTEEG
jgi:hypothetical protein